MTALSLHPEQGNHLAPRRTSVFVYSSFLTRTRACTERVIRSDIRLLIADTNAHRRLHLHLESYPIVSRLPHDRPSKRSRIYFVIWASESHLRLKWIAFAPAFAPRSTLSHLGAKNWSDEPNLWYKIAHCRREESSPETPWGNDTRPL